MCVRTYACVHLEVSSNNFEVSKGRKERPTKLGWLGPNPRPKVWTGSIVTRPISEREIKFENKQIDNDDATNNFGQLYYLA